MWDIRRNTQPMAELPNPFVVEFNLSEVPENQSRHWLIFKDQEVDLCHIDYGFEVDVLIEVSAYKLTRVRMGWESMQAAIDKGELKLIGNRAYTKIASQWLGQSSVGHIPKMPPARRI